MGLLDFLKRKDDGAAAAAARPAAAGGCPACGKALADGVAAAPKACALCGEPGASATRCKGGHAVCATCRDASAPDLIERVAARAPEKDPVALALRLFRAPALVRDGPAPPVLVSTVLVAAWSNAAGQAARRAERVAEARRRAEADAAGDAKPAASASGAAVGASAFVTLAGGAKAPPDAAERLITRAVALAGDAARRCQKRDSLLTILAAVKHAREHMAIELPASGVGCESSGRASECLGAGCPFNR